MPIARRSWNYNKLVFGYFKNSGYSGMRLAILDRDVQLARQQWVVVAGVVAIGLMMGCWLTTLSARAVRAPQQSGVMTIVAASSRQTMGISAPTIPHHSKIASSKLPPD